MNDETITEIITKLVGDIYPIGETNHDIKSNSNLETYCKVTLGMVSEIINVYNQNLKSYEGSKIQAREISRLWLKEIQTYVNELSKL